MEGNSRLTFDFGSEISFVCDSADKLCVFFRLVATAKLRTIRLYDGPGFSMAAVRAAKGRHGNRIEWPGCSLALRLMQVGRVLVFSPNCHRAILLRHSEC